MPNYRGVMVQRRCLRTGQPHEGRSRGRKRRPPGLALGCFHPTQQWQLDSLEYADKLPEQEKRWLARFLEAHYHGRRNGAQKLALQRASDRARKANSEDLLTRAAVVGRTREIDEGLGAEHGGGRAGGAGAEFGRRAPVGDDAGPTLGLKRVARPRLDERHDDEEEKRIEAIDAADEADLRDRIRAFRRR